MARKTSTDAVETIAAPKKGEFKAAVKAFLAHKDKTSTEARAIIDNVEHVHAGVFKTVARLDKMDAVKRGEWLFHFDIAREFYDWLKAEPSLGLSDREEEPAEEPIKPRAKKKDDDAVDLRPRHLRQPNASGAPARQDSATVTPLNPPRRDVQAAADLAEANLDKVGRGPEHVPDKTKH